MSAARMARFIVTNSSTHSCGSCAHRLRGSATMRCTPGSMLFFAMLSPQFVGLVLQFRVLQQQLVVTVPLHEVCPAHERAVLACTPVIVPQGVVGEVDR